METLRRVSLLKSRLAKQLLKKGPKNRINIIVIVKCNVGLVFYYLD